MEIIVMIHKILVPILFYILIMGTIQSQPVLTNIDSGNVRIGVISGISISNESHVGFNVGLESHLKINQNFSILFSIGYFNTSETINRIKNDIGELNYNGMTYFQVSSYKLVEILYDLFPFTTGITYSQAYNKIVPFISLLFNYNFAISKTVRTPGNVMLYSSYGDIPLNKMINDEIDLISNTISISTGIGFYYFVTNTFAISLRGIHIFDNKIINTSQIAVGISIQ